MKVLLEWVREWLAIELPPIQLAERLSLGGLAVDRVLDEAGASALDLDIASNRPDLLGHYGVAREMAAILQVHLAPLTTPPWPPAENAIEVKIDAPAACGRYLALGFDTATSLPCPPLVVRRLQALGQRSINFWADLTNYILWEIGHPTHAFDADTLRGGKIRIRFARAGETLVTLDEVERRLTGDDLVIADAERPIALAGIMGGLETAVSPRTRRIILESAWFEPLIVRAMARRHGMHTDASHRFERGADPEACSVAAARITASGLAAGAHLTRQGGAHGQLPQPARIALRAAAITRILGQPLAPDECRRALLALGCQPDGEAWRAPSWRHDLTREIDLIEEVARLHGLENFPARLPPFVGAARPLPDAALRDRVRVQLRGRGFAETIALSFASVAGCAAFTTSVPVQVLNPLSEEAAILRTSSFPSLLHGLQHNLHHGVDAPRLFEIGKIYDLASAGEPRERTVLSVGACDANLDFSGFKGEIEAVLWLFDLPPFTFTADAPDYLHPGRSARVGSWGSFGQIHPELAITWKLPTAVWLAELDLAGLLARGPRALHYAPVSRFPASERDFSFWLPGTATWSQVNRALDTPPIAHLAGAQPVEIFRDAKHPGQYSLLLRARFQSAERTLRDDEVQTGANQIVARLRALGGEQR